MPLRAAVAERGAVGVAAVPPSACCGALALRWASRWSACLLWEPLFAVSASVGHLRSLHRQLATPKEGSALVCTWAADNSALEVGGCQVVLPRRSEVGKKDEEKLLGRDPRAKISAPEAHLTRALRFKCTTAWRGKQLRGVGGLGTRR